MMRGPQACLLSSPGVFAPPEQNQNKKTGEILATGPWSTTVGDFFGVNTAENKACGKLSAKAMPNSPKSRLFAAARFTLEEQKAIGQKQKPSTIVRIPRTLIRWLKNRPHAHLCEGVSPAIEFCGFGCLVVEASVRCQSREQPDHLLHGRPEGERENRAKI